MSETSKKMSPFIPAVASFFIMGLGQLINKNKIKALVFFIIPVLVCTIEFVTSDWGRYFDITSGRADQTISQQDVDYGQEKVVEEKVEELAPQATFLGVSGGSSTTTSVGTGGDLFAGYEDTVFEETSYNYPNYELSPNGEKYIFRDFGGFFTRNVWGLLTLGRVVIGDEYAGKIMPLFDKDSSWLLADNSSVLIGNGLITLVVIILFVILWTLCILDAYKNRASLNETGEAESFKVFIRRIWRDSYVYIMLAPAFVLILFFTLIPFLFTFLLAFTNYTYKIKLGAMLINWSGFVAFGQAFVDPGWLVMFGKIFLWTVFWAFMSSFTVYALGFINALIIQSESVKGKKIWRSVMILPWAIPGLISLLMFKFAFNKDGLINQVLFATGLMEPVSNFLYHIGLEGQPDQPIYWIDHIYNGGLARAVVIMVNLWLGAPYHMMMITGCLTTISADLYEAAEIDGASGWDKFKAITLPSVLQATMPALIMTFSFNFNNFGAVYFLTGGGPLYDPATVPASMRVIGGSLPGQTDILISWIYKLSFNKGSEVFNIAAVYSIFIFLIVGGFAIYSMQHSKSFSEEL
ncbi:MAG: ABC transporter permease [Treponema sp. CETP13]|nr:MAG: ABC transporter permease [Treponema sp. CETP13]